MRSLIRVAPAIALIAGVACADTQEFRTGSATPERSSNDEPAAILPHDPEPPTPGVVVLATEQGMSAEDPDRQGPWAVVTDETWVYWIDVTSHVARVPTRGGAVESLADTSGFPHLFELAGDALYFTNAMKGSIERLPKNGGAIETMTPTSTEPSDSVQAFAVDGARVTWVGGKRVLRCETMPCRAPRVIKTADTLHPTGLGTFGERVFVPFLQEELQFPDTLRPGGILEPLGAGQVSIMPLHYTEVVGDVEPTNPLSTAVYAASQNLIVRAAFPGVMIPKVLASGDDTDGYPYAIQLAGAYVYWLNRGGSCAACKTVTPGAIMRVKKDGTEKPETVYRGEARLNGLTVGKDALYVSTNGGTVLKVPRPADRPLR